MRHLRYICLLWLVVACVQTQAQTAAEQKKFWKQVRKEMPGFRKVFRKYKKYRFEIVYTRVIHDPVNNNGYQTYHFGQGVPYFYPASTVKFPMAVQAYSRLEKLLEDSLVSSGNICITPKDSVFCAQVNTSFLSHKYLRITDSLSPQHAAAMGGIGREEFCRINNLDPFKKIGPGTVVRTTANPVPLTLNEMMSEMLIYSNNNHFNWLFEFACGQMPRYYNGNHIRKRLMVCPNEDSLSTRDLLLLQENGAAVLLPGQEIYFGPYNEKKLVGKKYYDFEGKLVPRGRDFTFHNSLGLENLQRQLIDLVYPGYTRGTTGYDISETHRRQVIRYMGMKPSEDRVVSDSNYLKVKDDFTNFLYTGQSHETLPPHLRIVNVIGQAYGFVTDCAYFADEKNRIDFFLAARIYVNRDEVLNDDKYEYAEIAYPLMEKLGKIIYQYELTHPQGSGALVSPVFQIFR